MDGPYLCNSSIRIHTGIILLLKLSLLKDHMYTYPTSAIGSTKYTVVPDALNIAELIF